MTHQHTEAQEDVCYVDENGQIVCEVNTVGTYSTSDVAGLLQSTDPQRIALIAALIQEVLDSPLAPDCIATRTADLVQSAHILLANKPPAMIMYKYSTLPGDILGTYYVNKVDYATARMVFDIYGVAKPGC